jgi:hypothetical protein
MCLMDSFVWNCRGGGNRWTVRVAQNLCQKHNPGLVFLCETRQTEERMKSMCARIGLKGFAAVGSDGRSGGIALFWHESLLVEVLGKGSRYIDVCVKDGQNADPWRATFVYGEPRVENRHLMWELLGQLKNVSTHPWVVTGDFNEAMWQHEHCSQRARPEG